MALYPYESATPAGVTARQSRNVLNIDLYLAITLPDRHMTTRLEISQMITLSRPKKAKIPAQFSEGESCGRVLCPMCTVSAAKDRATAT